MGRIWTREVVNEHERQRAMWNIENNDQLAGTLADSYCHHQQQHFQPGQHRNYQGTGIGPDLDQSRLYVQTIYGRNLPQVTERSVTSHLVHQKFNDWEFPATDDSLGDSAGRRIRNPFAGNNRSGWHVSRWLPPELLNWPVQSQYYPLSVFNKPRPGDIVQGKLGDCWLIAALSLVTEIPSILYKIVVTKKYNPSGQYQIRLCDRGLWKMITVDDQFPVNKTNFFIFTYAKRRQLFASLIEKAFAKLHGNYSALKSGRCDEGLQALTGEPTEVIFLRSSGDNSTVDYDAIWYKLQNARSRGYLMTCPASNPKLSDTVFDQRGIESNHAYSIMDVSVSYMGSARLVSLRNPWGVQETTNPTSQSFSNNSVYSGLITMHFEEMPYYFSSISICKFNLNWTDVRKRGQFSSFSSPMVTSAYTLEVLEPMEMVIELFNAGDGWYYNRRHDPDVDLCLIIERDGQVVSYHHDVDFYVSYSCSTITPGQYHVYALSFSALHHKVYPIYNIVFHASKHFVVHDHSLPSTELGVLFQRIAFAQQHRHALSKDATIMTFNDNGNFGMVIENRYPQAIRVQSDFRGTKNVLSSRGSSLCIDVIPPFSRLLIVMFTRRVYKGNVLISYKTKAQKVSLTEHHQPRLNPDNYMLHSATRLV